MLISYKSRLFYKIRQTDRQKRPFFFSKRKITYNLKLPSYAPGLTLLHKSITIKKAKINISIRIKKKLNNITFDLALFLRTIKYLLNYCLLFYYTYK
jgi:hypothetical protein